VLKVDLHLHTGEDPSDRIPHSAVDLVNRAAELGFDALAITLHDSQFADPRVSALARERGITLIPGIERTIGGRHVLLLNFPAAAAESTRTLDDVARLKARTAGLVIAPHPYFPDRSCLRGELDAHADLFDAVEWSYFWTRGVTSNARRARAYAGKQSWQLRSAQSSSARARIHDRCSVPPLICDAIRHGQLTLRPQPVRWLERTLSPMILRPPQAGHNGA
jgi:predicted metal-dependent phosphoesterase TrpH